MGLFNKWKKKVEVEPYRISAPVAGKVIDIKDTNDRSISILLSPNISSISTFFVLITSNLKFI